MKKQHTVPTGISHLGLKVEFTPVRMSLKSGLNLMKELGNPLFEVNQEKDSIVAVNQIEKIAYDHTAAELGELVWKCDYCGAYSKTRRIVDAHEQTCQYKHKNKG